ncbi:hypothetical protein NQ315_002926 [Exocentrus adspersus]|uniref:Uncharacterized protein n=1 Tax=Exocentrus adspersus TaxID=1586481 RepID=A0AAV8V9C1_9CUCU|nr:hypothetical protein NQ315_002926 [Exocentrus adspersus]
MSFFESKVALVTGGARGIGLAIVEKLLENGIKGVAIVDISDESWNTIKQDFQSQYGNKVLFIKADITDKDEFEGAFEKTVHTFKNLDIVVNNAGISGQNWEKIIAVNLEAVIMGTFLAMDKYLPTYRSGKEGIIVNIASLAGLLGLADKPVYTATKHGVVGLGKSLGADKSKNHVRIITVCPGWIATSMTEDVTDDDLKSVDPSHKGKALYVLIVCLLDQGNKERMSNSLIWQT